MAGEGAFWSIHYCMEGGGCYYLFVMICVHVFLYHWLDKTWNLQSFLNWKLKKYLQVHLWSSEKCVLCSVMFGILTSVHIILSILFDRNIWPSFILVHSYKVSFCVFGFFFKESAIVGGYVSIYQRRFLLGNVNWPRQVSGLWKWSSNFLYAV